MIARFAIDLDPGLNRLADLTPRPPHRLAHVLAPLDRTGYQRFKCVWVGRAITSFGGSRYTPSVDGGNISGLTSKSATDLHIPHLFQI